MAAPFEIEEVDGDPGAVRARSRRFAWERQHAGEGNQGLRAVVDLTEWVDQEGLLRTECRDVPALRPTRTGDRKVARLEWRIARFAGRRVVEQVVRQEVIALVPITTHRERVGGRWPRPGRRLGPRSDG